MTKARVFLLGGKKKHDSAFQKLAPKQGHRPLSETSHNIWTVIDHVHDNAVC